MSSFVQRASARAVVSCLVGLFLSACTGAANAPVSLARPQPKGHQTQAVSSGYSGTAQFDAPVVDMNTWQGNPIGTGSWSVNSTPTSTGGPHGIGGLDSQSGSTTHYVVIANFQAGPGQYFAIVSEGLMAVGTSSINNSTLFAGVFDANTGDPVSLATSGTVTLTAAGAIGGRLTGSFSGTLDDVAVTPPPGCTSNAQCATGELCVSGQCVAQPPGCTSNAQCSSGQVCQAGQCVTIPSGCTSNAQCSSGQICQSGQCVAGPSGCTSNAQCPSGQTCQAGRCAGTTPSACNGLQGSGAYSGSAGALNACTAFGSGAVGVTQGMAAIGDDGSGLALYVMDPSRTAAGVLIPLTGCPSATGTIAASGATFWDETSSGGVTLYASRPATSASVSYTQVGAQLKGTFTLALTGGGQLTGSFDVQ